MNFRRKSCALAFPLGARDLCVPPPSSWGPRAPFSPQTSAGEKIRPGAQSAPKPRELIKKILATEARPAQVSIGPKRAWGRKDQECGPSPRPDPPPRVTCAPVLKRAWFPPPPPQTSKIALPGTPHLAHTQFPSFPLASCRLPGGARVRVSLLTPSFPPHTPTLSPLSSALRSPRPHVLTLPFFFLLPDFLSGFLWWAWGLFCFAGAHHPLALPAWFWPLGLPNPACTMGSLASGVRAAAAAVVTKDGSRPDCAGWPAGWRGHRLSEWGTAPSRG